MSPSQLLLRLSLFVLCVSFVVFAKEDPAANQCATVNNLPYTINAENFTINFDMNNGQPEFQFQNKKDMKSWYYSTFLGVQEAMKTSNGTNPYTFYGTFQTGAPWTFCLYPMTNMSDIKYSFYGTAAADAFTAISLNGSVDATMNMTMMNFPVTKPNLTIANYQWTETSEDAMLAGEFDLEWQMNNEMQKDNNLYNEENTAIDWEDAYLQAYTAMDSQEDMVKVTMQIANQVMKTPANMNQGYAFYDHFEGTLTAPLDMGFGNTDKTPTNGSGWKIIVSIAVVAVVAVVAIALLGFCLLRRRGRSRSYQRV